MTPLGKNKQIVCATIVGLRPLSYLTLTVKRCEVFQKSASTACV